jgi:hypothetical protein
MIAVKVELKSPIIPLFQRENFFAKPSEPLFGKACPEPSRREGKGRFSDATMRELCSELLGQDTREET